MGSMDLHEKIGSLLDAALVLALRKGLSEFERGCKVQLQLCWWVFYLTLEMYSTLKCTINIILAHYKCSSLQFSLASGIFNQTDNQMRNISSLHSLKLSLTNVTCMQGQRCVVLLWSFLVMCNPAEPSDVVDRLFLVR